MRATFRAACGLAVVVWAAPSAVRASDPAQQVVRQNGEEAAARFLAGEYAAALAHYRAIEPLLGTMKDRDAELWTVRFNIARCLDELKRPVDAVLAYRRVLRGPLAPELQARVEARVRVLEAAAMGTIEVRCTVPGAVVTLLGHEPRGDCGDRWGPMAPGPYTIEGRAPDGTIDRAVIELHGGQTLALDLTLRSAPVAAAIAPAGRDRTLPIALTAGASALVAGAVVFHVFAQAAVEDGDRAFARYQMTDDARALAASEQDARDADDRAGRDAVVSYVLFGVGAAVGAAAAWAWFADEPADEAAWVPVVGPSGVGLTTRF